LKYYIIAGEASGDLHGANLMKAISNEDAEADFRFWGGDRMADVGGRLVKHYKDMAFMGFVEVVKNLFTILDYIKLCKKDLTLYEPDVVILIDYPGFNLRIAAWAKAKGNKVVYYITPQVWAWHKSRVHALDKFTDLKLVILPFEEDFFNKYGYQANFVGHPLLDAIQDFTPDKKVLYELQAVEKPILALLPGSRTQEINAILPTMLAAVKNIPYHIVIAVAPSQNTVLYTKIIEKSGISQPITLLDNQTYTLLSIAKLALVGSGTATLETALFGVPQVVCYKGNPISFTIAKRLVKLKYISLVNLIMDKEVVTELIQNDLNPARLSEEIHKLALNTQIKADYNLMRGKLGNVGASARAAHHIVQLISEK